MRYAHILMAVASEYWAIDPAKMDQIVAFLALQASGEKLSPEEVAKISNRAANEAARREGSVAVLPLRGVIANRVSMMSDISGGTSSEGFARMFDAALNDPNVKAIVMDVDSPGGVVPGTEELSSRIFAARGTKPIIAQVNSTAASAAYWIATAADEVVMSPSAQVGSIGVLTIHEDVSASLEKIGIKKTVLSAGKFKAEGSPFGPLDEEATAHYQSRANEFYDVFTRRVAKNRNTSLSAVTGGFGQGRTVTAQAAIAEGMADRIGTMDDTLARFGASTQPATRSGNRAFALQREKRALALKSF